MVDISDTLLLVYVASVTTAIVVVRPWEGDVAASPALEVMVDTSDTLTFAYVASVATAIVVLKPCELAVPT